MKKGQYKGEKPFDRNLYMKAYNKKFYAENKEREKERVRIYSKLNPEKVKKSRKKWYQLYGIDYRKKHIKAVREAARKYAKKYRLNNPEKIREQNRSDENKIRQKRYRQNRILTPEQKIRNCLAGRIITAIKRRYTSKAYKTIELLGCSIKKVREHLEVQFKENMSWENHGKVWEIDHITPLDHFDLTKIEEQKKAFHYTNLQPLNWQENRKKSNRIMI